MAHHARRRVAITGLGLTCSLGRGLDHCWLRLLAGETGIAPIDLWDPRDYQTKVAATIQYERNPLGPSNGVRAGFEMYLGVVHEALTSAALAGDQDRSAIGIASGASVNNIDMRQIVKMVDHLDGQTSTLNTAAYLDVVKRGDAPGPMYPHLQGGLINTLPMRRYGLRGPSLVMDTACAASTHAIGESLRLIRRGTVDVMIAGGAAALVRPIHILAFERLGALTPSGDPASASRPFDRDRDGFVMGEAAGVVVLESFESAKRRGVPILAELAGYGSTSNAGTMTDPSPNGEHEARAMRAAIDDAGVAPERIGYVAAHGTSTPKGDVAETLGIRRVFGAHSDRLLVSSNKGQLGHTIAAAGVCNLAAAVQVLRTGWAPPTATLKNPDPQCDLNYVPEVAQRAEVEAALSNSFGFGGQNASLVVRRVSDAH